MDKKDLSPYSTTNSLKQIIDKNQILTSKYRIKETTTRDGEKEFWVEYGTGTFWTDIYDRFTSLEDARRVLKRLQDKEIVNTRYHY